MNIISDCVDPFICFLLLLHQRLYDIILYYFTIPIHNNTSMSGQLRKGLNPQMMNKKMKKHRIEKINKNIQ